MYQVLVPVCSQPDPLASSLERKLAEIDLLDGFAWWLVTHVGCNSESAWNYVCIANAWHERAFGVGFACGMPLSRERPVKIFCGTPFEVVTEKLCLLPTMRVLLVTNNVGRVFDAGDDGLEWWLST